MNRKAKMLLGRFWRWVRPIAFVAIVLCAFRSSVADWNDVPTGSMKPSIVEGDRIFVNKLAYDLKVPFTRLRLAEWSRPQRGDIVVFLCPGSGTRMVKRVIGLPGDLIEMQDNRLTINGRPASYEKPDHKLEEQIGHLPPGRRLVVETTGRSRHPIVLFPSVRSRRSFAPLIVPDGQYFLMGDNRDESMDSRFFGAVPEEQIVGRCEAIVFSVDRKAFYRPRFDRFFRTLP